MRNDILTKYNITEEVLFSIFDQLLEFIASNGGIVKFVDLSKVIETDIYVIDPDRMAELMEGAKHHETAISDSLNIYLHNDLDEVGIEGRIYDLLHLGAGHYWQWNSPNDSEELSFSGDAAWEFGQKFYLDADNSTLDDVWEYEHEAGRIALFHLSKILSIDKVHSQAEKDSIFHFYSHYLSNDLQYIDNFYRSGDLPDFYMVWSFNHAHIKPLEIRKPMVPRKRQSKCVPLIRGKGKYRSC